VDVGVTEVALQLTVTDADQVQQISVERDGKEISRISCSGDSIIYDENLRPNQSYTYQAFLLDQEKKIYGTGDINITTIDTTSHVFKWDYYSFGNNIQGSVLFDVAIINENDIWAVGEIYADSSSNKYNAVHWNGQGWELKKILYAGGFAPITSVFAFNENDIWFGIGYMVHWDGEKYEEIEIPDFHLRVNKIWGVSSSDLYIIADSGTIVHYVDGNWHKIVSRTDVNLLDIYGSLSDNVILAGGYQDFKPTVLLSIKENQVETLFADQNNLFNYLSDFISGGIFSTWIDPLGRIYILTWYDLYLLREIDTGNAKSLWGKDYNNWVSSKIRGYNINDIVTVGLYGRIWHYNGFTWKLYEELINQFDRLNSVAVLKDLIVAVGYRYLSSIERYGIIYIGRR